MLFRSTLSRHAAWIPACVPRLDSRPGTTAGTARTQPPPTATQRRSQRAWAQAQRHRPGLRSRPTAGRTRADVRPRRPGLPDALDRSALCARPPATLTRGTGSKVKNAGRSVSGLERRLPAALGPKRLVGKELRWRGMRVAGRLEPE